MATWPNTSSEAPGASPIELPRIDRGETAGLAPEWAQQVAESRARVHYQGQLVGLRKQELTDDEFDAIADLEKEKREQTRQQELRHFEAELADADAEFEAGRTLKKSARRFEAARAKSTAVMQEWRQRAAHAAERLTSHDMRLAQLTRQLTWTRRVLITLMAVGMAWSAVNVQHNLVPSGNSAEALFWVSYGVEALVSGCLIVLLMTSATLERWGYDRARHGRSGYALEAVLVFVSLGLNIGTPLSHGDVPLALEYSVAPLMVGALVGTYNYATGALSRVLAEQAHADIRQRYAGLLADGELLALAGRGLAAMNDGVLRPSTAEDGGGVPSASALASGLGVSKPRACQVRDAMKLLRVIGDQR
ncbi:hypothetical protein HFP15_40920 [Amycolatopsis sp. K13G38]|uniref:DUF2637 domain-containing protein n=1 Tax=Amycolatopsis acididurans TaxID=2724524 RepID=A0ABX1JKP5_9PSEU|nr:hypothetical protein [Amycolatopsis acididurans]NKQ59221.1 hypothetical protein [Amycolatopsis acididurans]